MLTWSSSFAKAQFQRYQISSLQAYADDFVAGSTQCQVRKESALMKIRQNHLVEEFRFQVKAKGSTSSQVSSPGRLKLRFTFKFNDDENNYQLWVMPFVNGIGVTIYSGNIYVTGQN